MTIARTLSTACFLISAGAASAYGQERVAFLAASAERGVTLRWAWGDGERPAGWLVERRADNGPWVRLTSQPVTRIRDRAAARTMLGERFVRLEGLLFPDDPRAELADPESHRSLQLLAADVDPDVARVLGLRYDDASASTGQRYQYQLIAVGRQQGIVATSGVVEAGRYRPADAPDSLRASQGRRGLALRWKPDAAYSAYHVYKGVRADGSDAVRLNRAPVVVFLNDDGARTEAAPIYFTDTSSARPGTVYFVVEGVDAFGRTSRRSPPLAATWLDLEAPPPPVVRPARNAGDTVVVAWDASPARDIAAYQVWRAASDTGPFLRLGSRVSSRIREFRDPNRPARQLSWYRVSAIDSAGHEGGPSALVMLEVPDVVPPTAPVGLVAIADTGRITLTWSAVPVRDLLGYRVHRAATDTGAFTMISATPRRDTRIVDDIPRGADHPYFYRVTAVDSAYNESAPTAVVAARPPDAAAPASPRVARVRRGARSLVVEWFANIEPDVVAYRVRFRSERSVAWIDAPSVATAAARTMLLNGLEPGLRYEIIVLAVDDARNVSSPSPVARGTPLPMAMGAPELRRARYDEANRSVRLEWAAVNVGVVELLVLRGEDDGALRPIGAAVPGATTFIDGAVRTGRRYAYALRARDASGTMTESRTLRVTTPERAR